MTDKPDIAPTTDEEQLARWVAGNARHNDHLDKCCPDFSCCRPDLLAPEHERQAFALAYETDERAMYSMLGSFLGRAVAGHDVYVTGEAGEQEQ